jgi:hypothetical protein
MAARPRLTQAQTAEALAVRNSGPPGPWATHPVGRVLGRVARPNLSGPVAEPARDDRALLPTGGSQGNAGFIRGAPTGGPDYCGGRHGGGGTAIPVPGGSSPRDYTTESRTGPAFHNGQTITYDRHVMAKTGTETQRAGPRGGGRNGQGLSPLADGPVRPVFMLVHRAMAPRYGNDGTRHLDNNGPFAVTTDNLGRTQPLGVQDGSPYSRIYGGTPGLTYIYGMRGTAGVVSPVPVGAPGDGPQMIRGGVPHGLHSQAQPNAQLRGRRYAAIPQQKNPRRSLPKNSARAGQSWSQNAQRLGSAPVSVPATTSRAPGVAAGRLGR